MTVSPLAAAAVVSPSAVSAAFVSAEPVPAELVPAVLPEPQAARLPTTNAIANPKPKIFFFMIKSSLS